MSISIIIPTYDQQGHGPKMVTQLLNTIRKQKVSYEYEVVISDTSTTEEIREVCEDFIMIPIRYTRNTETFGASENINHAIGLAKYNLVKLMCQDDLFALVNSIDLFVEALANNNWVISNSVHVRETGEIYGKRLAAYNHGQFTKNITGMPSVVGWKKCDIRFDERLKTVQDMFFYHQLYELYGQPGLIKEFAIGCRFWRGALSHNQVSNHNAEVKFLQTNRMI